jgi:hypothetical protein
LRGQLPGSGAAPADYVRATATVEYLVVSE